MSCANMCAMAQRLAQGARDTLSQNGDLECPSVADSEQNSGSTGASSAPDGSVDVKNDGFDV